MARPKKSINRNRSSNDRDDEGVGDKDVKTAIKMCSICSKYRKKHEPVQKKK